MKTPIGTIEPTFQSVPKEKNLIACIILAQKSAEKIKTDPRVLDTVLSRRNFFKRLKKDIVLFSGVERGLPAPIFDNLAVYERLLGVRIYIWRQIGQYEIKQIYNSPSPRIDGLRVNILSKATVETDLR